MSPLLSPAHIALIDQGVSVIVASRDAQLRPSVMRAMGSQISADGSCITVYLRPSQAQPLLADRQQQFDLIQPQRLRAMAVGIGQFRHAVFQQGGALADAQQLVAQHAIGGFGLLQALRLRALALAECFDTRVQRAALLFGQRQQADLACLPLRPRIPAARAQREQHQQDEQQAAGARTAGGRGGGRVAHAAMLNAGVRGGAQ